ncbi:SRPBCC family protein [Streptomyces sp. NPDC002888]|uniref:SRPBCC family protein n=1 Tax=Streptomyces sp. NPDC002888 TaxID=3364668 RepID=UPI0036B886DA
MEHEVFVPVPAERLRGALADPAQVARALPGLQQDAGSEPVAGRLKLRVGGHTITYRGAVRVSARDDGTYAVEGEATEVRGHGTVKLAVTLRLADTDTGSTVTFSGTATADGRITEQPTDAVSMSLTRLLSRFAENLGAGEQPTRSERAQGTAPATVEGVAVEDFEPTATGDFEATPDADDAPAPEAKLDADDAPAPEAKRDADDASAPEGPRTARDTADTPLPGPTGSEPTEAKPAEATRPERPESGADESEAAESGPPESGPPESGPPESGPPESGPPEAAGPPASEFPEPAEPAEPSEAEDAEAEPPGGFEEVGGPPAEAAHARRTMIGRSAEEVDHAPPRGRYAPVPAPQTVTPNPALRWAVPAAAFVVASAIVAGRALRRRR